MAREWTKNQKLAIETPANVLVNAAAGSGKTAVLVERIIRKIINGGSADRLLVVTFARDAAQEMQQRIKNALINKQKEVCDESLKLHLKQQIRILAASDITTIDAFCINVVKLNFHHLGIDPAFGIMDADEAKVLLDITLDDFLNHLYENADERVFFLSKHYSKGYSDFELKNKIREIFLFTRSLPNPKEWIRESAEKYLQYEDEIYNKGIYPAIRVLCEIVCEFDDFYYALKREKNTYEFNDLEHMCLELFEEFPDVREEYTNKYDEILMDEYQDTNGLQEAIFGMISQGRFMVGDMKQSIYRFRKSDPFIFKGKDRQYSEFPEEGTRIVLSDNFRSRPQVLNSINQIFVRIMSEESGEVNYDESQSLNWGNKSYDNPDDESYFSELHILEGPDSTDDGESNTRVEARFIAGKIRQMIDEGFLVSDGGEKRPATPEDFAIILNSVKYVGDIYIDELRKAGIDAIAESVGYFNKTEVMLILSILRIINNPLQDIPLVTVMRSPVFGFFEDELAIIRTNSKGCFFDAVEKTTEGELGKKCAHFLNLLNRWRDYSKYMSSDRLIWTVYEETNLYDLMGIMSGGAEAQSNLRLLFEKAKQYESTGFHGLYHFLMYVDRMDKTANFGGAPAFSDDKKPVRIMTIHKSKGLEFPVCFVSGVGKRMTQVVSTGLVMHKDYGIGIDYINPDEGYYMHTPLQEEIREVIKNEALAEDMRKLYVAMTRAKEKLILTGVVSKKKYDQKGNLSGGASFELAKLADRYDIEADVMSDESVKKANRYFDWIAPIVKAHGKNIGWKLGISEYSGAEELVLEERDNEESDISQESVDMLMEAGVRIKQKSAPGKISVTGLLRINNTQISDDDVYDIDKSDAYVSGILKKPEFMSAKKALSGAQRGNAYHKLMAELDISGDISKGSIKEQMKNICTEEECSAIDVNKISAFLESSLGQRLRKSKNIMREQAFEIGVNAADTLLNSDGFMLLQGIIDCFFEEDGGFVLIDYKTDRNKSEVELADCYGDQLLWYKIAVERLTGKNVLGAYLYSFENDLEIKII